MFNSRRLERCDISSFCYTTTVCIILFSHFEFVYVSLFYISCDVVYIVLLFLYISFLCLNPSNWWNQRQYVYSLSVHRCVRSWVVVSVCSPVLFIRFSCCYLLYVCKWSHHALHRDAENRSQFSFLSSFFHAWQKLVNLFTYIKECISYNAVYLILARIKNFVQ